MSSTFISVPFLVFCCLAFDICLRKQENTKMDNGVALASFRTEPECKGLCMAALNCVGVDWSEKDERCYYHHVQSPKRRCEGYTHYMPYNCSAPTSSKKNKRARSEATPAPSRKNLKSRGDGGPFCRIRCFMLEGCPMSLAMVATLNCCLIFDEQKIHDMPESYIYQLIQSEIASGNCSLAGSPCPNQRFCILRRKDTYACVQDHL